MHFKRTVYKSGAGKARERVKYVTRDDLSRTTLEKEAAARGEAVPEKGLDRNAESHLRYAHRPDREDLVYTHSRNLPAWAQNNPETYFCAAEEFEWVGGNAFEEWKITLPHELTPVQNFALMRDLVDSIAGDRLPCTVAFHAPETLSKSKEQPHLHLLISGRQRDGIPRTPQQHFKKHNTKHPERGGAPKDPALYHLRAVKAWRVTITDLVNVHLERAGLDERVHPDRLEDRGIDRKPEPKLRPRESAAYRGGVVTPRMQAVLDARETRGRTRAVEQADARDYWETRKEALGIDAAMDAKAQLATIRAARETRRDQAPGRTPVVEDPVDTRDAARHAEDGAVLVEAARAEAWMAWGMVEDDAAQTAPVVVSDVDTTVDALRALAAQLAALTGDEEAGGRGRGRLRLWDRDAGLGH